MKTLNRIVMAAIVAAFFVGAVAAQTVVAGTGNADIDIAAVQAAVDKGGSVMLRGHFSFDNPPGARGDLPDLMATILVSKAVTISGAWDEHGQITMIDGGEIPFAVEARGATVRMEKLRFIRPKLFAIFVAAAGGLAIESCIIESVEPRLLPGTSTGRTSAVGIYVSTVIGLPTLERPGDPGNVSGKLSIVNNQITATGPADHGIGIMIGSVGSPQTPADVEITGNSIRNTTLKGINAMQVSGHTRIEGNTVTMSALNAGRTPIAGIHCGGTGSYAVAHNIIEVADPDGAGIRIRDYPALGAAMEHATITDNDVTMSAPEGAVFGMGSSGIEIMGLARGVVVQRNRILGRARVAMYVAPGKSGSPSGNTIDGNDVQGLVSPSAEVGLKK